MAGNRNAKGLVGSVVAERYRIIERIGAGAMATIYRATRLDDDLELAVKVVLPKLAKNRTVAARIQREAKAATKLNHPGCVKIYDWGVDGETLYIAMELIQGEDVFELIQRERRLPQLRAVDIALDVLDVLAHAHAVGVVHRDLKPENIMLLSDPDGSEHIKILDFGIAKLIGPDLWSDETVPEKLTRAGSAVGTPSHMAPEQARGVEVDGRADIYACGVLLYETLSGHLPFEGKSPIEVAVKQVRDPPRPPSEHFPELNPELERIILRCLEKDPAQRWQTAEALAEQLRLARPQLEGATAASRALPAAVRESTGTIVISATDDELSTLQDIPPHLRALMDLARKTQAQGGFGGDDDDNLPTLHFDGSKSSDEEVTLLEEHEGLPPPLDDNTLRRPGTQPFGIGTQPFGTRPFGTGALAHESKTAPRAILSAAQTTQPLQEEVVAPRDHYGSQHPPAYLAPPALHHPHHPSQPPAETQLVLSTYGTQPTRSNGEPRAAASPPSRELDHLLSSMPTNSRKWLFIGGVAVVMLCIITATFLLVR